MRRRLAQIATDISRGAIEDKRARTLTYVLNSVAMILRTEKDLEIENRLLELEKAAGIVPRLDMNTKGENYAEELATKN